MSFIPLGEECCTCESIDSKFNADIRKCAYPFDYVGHTFVDKLASKIENLMNDEELNNISIKQFGDKYFYVDEKYGFNYWHDTNYTTIDQFTEIDKSTFIEKYNRRYQRLKDAMTQDNIFISCCHFDNIYSNNYKKDSIINLYNTLNKFNPNSKMISFNYDADNFTIDNLTNVNISYTKTDNFEESKNNFKKELFNYIHKII